MASLIHDYETFGEYLENTSTMTSEYIYRNTRITSDIIDCKCCKRHKKDFTDKNDKGQVSFFTSGNISKLPDLRCCKCPCRHVGRFILRNQQDFITNGLKEK